MLELSVLEVPQPWTSYPLPRDRWSETILHFCRIIVHISKPKVLHGHRLRMIQHISSQQTLMVLGFVEEQWGPRFQRDAPRTTLSLVTGANKMMVALLTVTPTVTPRNLLARSAQNCLVLEILSPGRVEHPLSTNVP
mmetsp:Transcript_46441/g.123212  ORF Transcript_46441/g.123212 Transcript_46441/m.123212 type:complete len:137 (+) Transcript_46441:194-604(+)